LTSFEIEKIIGRFAESTNQKFTKIPDEIIREEKLLRLIDSELLIERRKVKQDTFAIQVLVAKLIGHKRLMTALKIKHKIK